MLEIITIAIFIWLFVKRIGFALKLTWGLAKIVGCVLMVAALPVLIVCLLFASTVSLLAPIALIAVSAITLKACL